MIQLDVNNSLLTKYFGITTSEICTTYANKSFEEIMEIEAAEGNKKAKEYEKILTNPDKIVEIFNLVSIENKFAILQNLSEDDLDKLLPLLNNDQLALGLGFFTDEKLLEMAKELPIEELVGMIFEEFDLENVLELMEESSMKAFLNETEVEREYIQTYFESLNASQLQGIMSQATGMDYSGKSMDEMVQELTDMQDNEYMVFVNSLERDTTMGLIAGICTQEEDLLLLFKPQDLVAPMDLMMKSDKIEILKGLDPEFLVPMVQELPLDLTQIVLTQIDPNDFAETISKEYTDILKSVVLFSNG